MLKRWVMVACGVMAAAVPAIAWSAMFQPDSAPGRRSLRSMRGAGLLGWLSLNERNRKHALHVATVIAAVGSLGAARTGRSGRSDNWDSGRTCGCGHITVGHGGTDGRLSGYVPEVVRRCPSGAGHALRLHPRRRKVAHAGGPLVPAPFRGCSPAR
jgi:hypothetical protein